MSEADAPHAVKALFAGREPTVQKNETVYYDTPDFTLWRNGVEVRVRESTKGIIQTVKSRIASGSAFTRNESEMPIRTADLVWEHIAENLPPELASRLSQERITPVFRTSVNRQRITFDVGGASIEAAMDIGQVIAGDRLADIREIELELKAGEETALAAAALDFLRKVPCGLLMMGKAARGFQLATDNKPAPVFASGITLPADTPLPDAIAMMLRSAFNHALANHAPLTETMHPEAVHQMRVGFRRLRAVLSAFKPVMDLSGAAGLQAETKRLFGLLGDVREADVFLHETLPDMPDAVFDPAFKQMVEKEVIRFRSQARRTVLTYTAGAEFSRLAIGWHQWIERGGWLRHEQPIDRLLANRPVGDFAVTRLQSMRRKLRKAGHRALTGTVDDWHVARIAAKKLRYAGAPLLAVIGEDAAAGKEQSKAVTKKLAKLQDELGNFNDLCNVGPFLHRVGEKAAPSHREEFARMVAFTDGWGQAEVQHAIPRLEKTWRRFEAAMEEHA